MLFPASSLGYSTPSVAQHITFHQATSQHDASFTENENSSLHYFWPGENNSTSIKKINKCT